MAPRPKLYAVVEAPWFDGAPPWPWPIADRKPFSFIRVSCELTGAEVGSIIAQLVKYNQVETGPSTTALLSGALAAEVLLLPGGIHASSGEREICPGCCCGLETWREWLSFLESGASPWAGHDPAPRLESVDGLVRVWSDGGISPTPDAYAIEFDRIRFTTELGRVERDLRAFLSLVGAWAENVGFPDPPALCRKLDACFGITGPASIE